jgi:hypothetical protein
VVFLSVHSICSVHVFKEIVVYVVMEVVFDSKKSWDNLCILAFLEEGEICYFVHHCDSSFLKPLYLSQHLPSMEGADKIVHHTQ